MTALLEVRGLTFRYPGARAPALVDFQMQLEPGARCLLVGRNGAGKSTLLHVLAGRHLVPEEKVRVLGRAAFHDTSLAHEVSFLGGPFHFDVDIGVADILRNTPGVDAARRDRLLAVLGVDPGWHMHRVSDGQRRRVQILLGLLRPSRLLLLDEITTDLDLLARIDLLALLREECEQRGSAILYATHIFDALEDWATHVALLEAGRLLRLDPIGALPLGDTPLHRLVERWLRDPV
jgi:CCR4-NOT complex subunit CAF16